MTRRKERRLRIKRNRWRRNLRRRRVELLRATYERLFYESVVLGRALTQPEASWLDAAVLLPRWVQP